MIPVEFSLQLQHGITGGFAPPTSQAIFTLTKASTDEFLLVTSVTRPIGVPSLQDGGTRALSIDDAKTQTLINELYSILEVLPTEEGSIGIDDIYRLDTSISWGSEGFWWSNSGPQGCGRGVSSVQPTREERAKFGRAVEIINDLVERADAA